MIGWLTTEKDQRVVMYSEQKMRSVIDQNGGIFILKKLPLSPGSPRSPHFQHFVPFLRFIANMSLTCNTGYCQKKALLCITLRSPTHIRFAGFIAFIKKKKKKPIHIFYTIATITILVLLPLPLPDTHTHTLI